MYMTEEHLRNMLALLVDAGGSLEVRCKPPDPKDAAVTTIHFGARQGPQSWEAWQLGKSLVSRGLAEASGMNDETGIERFTVTSEGRLVHEGAPMPPPPNAAVAPEGIRPMYGGLS